jgi:hypothetical protein
MMGTNDGFSLCLEENEKSSQHLRKEAPCAQALTLLTENWDWDGEAGLAGRVERISITRMFSQPGPEKYRGIVAYQGSSGAAVR